MDTHRGVRPVRPHPLFYGFVNTSAEKAEALLPVAASDIIRNNEGIIKFFTSSEKWFGMTYPEDRTIVKEEIAKKISEGYYPENLWSK